MRHFSLFDDANDEPIRKEAGSEEENTYYTLNFKNRDGLMGLLTIIQFASILLGVDQDKLNPLTDYIANAISSDDNVIRVNAEELDTLINAYNKTWDLYEEIGETDFINQWGSIVDESGSGLDDMAVAADAIFDAQPEPSSVADLENIPTMEKNPEDLAEGESPMGNQTEDIFGEVPELSEAPEYNPEPEVRPSLFEGWQFEQNPALDEQEDIPHSIPPATPAGQANMLQKHFDMPAVEHPLGPHTGAESLDNQYYTIPIDKNENELNSADIFFQWAEAYELLPEKFLNSNIVSRDEQGNPVFRFSGSEYSQMIQACNVFASLSKTNSFQLFNSLFASDTVYIMIERSKIFDGAIGKDPSEIMAEAGEMSQEQLQQQLTQLTEIMQPIVLGILNFIKKVTSIQPDLSSQANLENAFNAPTVKHPVEKPLGPDEGFDPRKASEGESQEFYTSGSFVKGPDGKWLVAINPSGGQREPMPGDWAEIVQRTKSFNRPVPLTLVEDMGGAWSFKNGHHPSI